MQPLKKIFHQNRDEWQKEYESRFNDKDSVHLKISIGENPAFFCQTVDMYKTLLSIEKTDKLVSELCSKISTEALSQFTRDCMMEEINSTSRMEGVNSTRKEIKDILDNLKKINKSRRLVGLTKKYEALNTRDNIKLEISEDIRAIYNDIFYEEVEANDPDSIPDGRIFRKSSVSVYSGADKEIHIGLLPEEKIISTMNEALKFLNNEPVNMLSKIAVFHYLFGYIHPFYDGNGRTSRFISSYYLSKELNPLIGYCISSAIKDNSGKYNKAFDLCNSPLNKGDLTPFAEMFLNFIDESETRLFDSLSERYNELNYQTDKIPELPNSEKSGMPRLYKLLIEAALFSEDGFSTQDLEEYTQTSYNTLKKKLDQIPEEFITKEKIGKTCYYKFDLESIE